MSRCHSWGVRVEEKRLPYPCDAQVSRLDAEMFRAVSVAAPPEVAFRWLCQLRVAPYSYDWIDNFGRRSPQQLTPGLEELAVGQRVMTIFELVEFQSPRQLTVRIPPSRSRRVFGEVAVTYRLEPGESGGCRLLAKLAVTYPPGLTGWLGRRLLPCGDLVMMRRQLLNLKRLAEGTAAAVAPAAAGG